MTILLYILLIFLLHSLWNYIKDNYSTKKTKDLVNSQLEKYKKIMEETHISPSLGGEQTTELVISTEEKQEMADELSALLT
jgi:hypothetical protein